MQNKKSNNIYDKTIKVLLIFMVLISFSSCKKECDKCEIRPPDIVKPVLFNLLNNSFKANFDFYKMNINGNYIESLSRDEKDEKLFLFVKDYCLNKGLPISNQTLAIVLYYDCPVSQSFTIIDEKISGISIYFVEKKKIKHLLFVKNSESIFESIENTKVAVPFVTHNHSQFYLTKYIFENAKNKSYISVMGNYAEEVFNNIKNYKRAPIRFEKKTTKGLVGDNSRCGSPCEYGTGGCIQSTNGYGCSSEVCYTQIVQSTLIENNLSESTFINLNLMYSFRDDFLDNYNKGNEYIDNYYFLSEEFKDNISISLALKTALFFFDFNSVMAAFVNPENHLTEIMFTEELTQDLLDLLDDYEEITNSTEGKAILASIRADINSFKNKQLQEILAMIN